MTDPTYDAIEYDDESGRDELARSIFKTCSTHVARQAAAKQHSRNGADYKDLLERIERLEENEKLEKTAMHILWDIDSPALRQAYLDNYLAKHGRDKHNELKRIFKRLAARHFVQLSEQEGL